MSTRPFHSFLALVLCAPAVAAAQDAPKADAPTAEAVLRRSADFYKKARSIAVEVGREQKTGPNPSMKSSFDVAFERPTKVAIRNKGATQGIDLISDGKTQTVFFAMTKRYLQEPAPAAGQRASTTRDLLVGILQGSLLFDLAADDPYKALMDGVRTSAYAGMEELEGARTHHLKFTQDQLDWEVWIAAEGDPLIRKAVVDMTKTIARGPAAAQLKGQKVELIHTYKGWKIDAELGPETFAFRPPDGAEKAADLMDVLGVRRSEPTSSLVGKPAPELGLEMLDDGGTLRLADHRGKDVVMLDFWATWCGPCVQELPVLAEVSSAYKDKGVAFFAINLREDPEKIRKFQSDRKLKFPVALDPGGRSGTSYGADAIPMLVLVDKKGVVQAVHVGYNPSIRTTLPKELDALLAGKDLPRPVAAAPRAPAPKDGGLERAWHLDGAYFGVATDPKGRAIFSVEMRGGRCDVLDADGKTIRTIPIATGNNQVLLAQPARLAGGEGLLAFSGWGPSVTALKGDGSKLWEESGGQGIDDVWPADLDGDGTDEAIVGYNGSTGLHVFSAEGKRLWKRTDLGNVWNVNAADLDGDGKPEVVSTSARGQVHVFAAKDGAPIAAMSPGIYATQLRVAVGRARPPAKGDLLIVAGGLRNSDAILAIDGDKKVRWTTDLSTSVASCQCLAVSPDGTKAAAGLLGGRVCVVEVANGRIVGQVSGLGERPEVAWAVPEGGGDPLLIVAGDGLAAFRLKPGSPATAGRP